MSRPPVLGLDIGGAHLKAATTDDQCASVPFAMWQRPHELAAQLVLLAAQLPACPAWAVTMTGEMADIFADRGVGVRTLVNQTLDAAKRVGVDDVMFYGVDGRFVSMCEAVADPDCVASANWHALANWIASTSDGPGLLIDVGSTTTDIIPLDCGRVATASRTDFDRLAEGELVYIGGGRTPVCSLVQSLPFEGRDIPVMREVFATTDDCALVLGLVHEDAQDRMTSDGGPRTIAAAVNRLARMIGLDHRGVDLAMARPLARAVIDAAAAAIAAAIARQPERFRGSWMLSGHTADYFLPPWLLGRNLPAVRRLADHIGPQLARVAPAFACAKLRQTALAATPVCADRSPPAQVVQGCAEVVQGRAEVGDGSVMVVKVGGSLLVRPDLPVLLRRWLKAQSDQRQVHFIIGGGTMIDALRQLDRIHRSDPAAMHWLCVRALRHTMQLVGQWLPELTRIESVEAFAEHRLQRPAGRFLIAPGAFYHEASGNCLPCDWTTTSDSIAALLARKIAANRLVLLKSCAINDAADLVAAAANGIIDPNFASLIAPELQVELVSFGAQQTVAADLSAAAGQQPRCD